jgi:hypothetical protein
VDIFEEELGDWLLVELNELERDGDGDAEWDRNDFFFFFFFRGFKWGGDETVELTPPLVVVTDVIRRDAEPLCVDDVEEVLLLTFVSSSCSEDG